MGLGQLLIQNILYIMNWTFSYEKLSIYLKKEQHCIFKMKLTVPYLP